MNVRSWVCAALIVLAASFAARAQEQPRGHYLMLGAGAAFPLDSDIEDTTINTSADFDTGWSVIGGVGYKFPENFRSELELGYRQADVDSLAGAATASGDINLFTVMGTVYYDFNVGWPVTPYLGAGIGYARVDANGQAPVGGSTLDDTDDVFAFQGVAGLSYQLTDTVAVFGDYRYFQTTDPSFTTNSGVNVDSEYADHRIMVGLRWSFQAPESPPEAAPAPKPVAAAAPKPAPPPKPAAKPKPAPAPKPVAKPEIVRTYLVFFDWDKSNLTPEAVSIIRTAAANAKKAKVTRIRATGHADRSGPDWYNMGLSKRRALSVRAELVRLGIPKGEIAIFWKGEREPLVPTPDGVREPQNRRVEIVLE